MQNIIHIFTKKRIRKIMDNFWTLSVCIIARDEEETIERLLNCVKQFADEIVFVDTGSTDSTKEIAKKFTNNTFDFKWCDDFSAARNFAFEKATCDFLMWLDADDFISQENIDKLKMLKVSQNDFDVCMCKYALDFDDNNSPHFIFERERILKRSLSFKWIGKVHESIIPKGKIIHSDITIEHRKIKRNKPKRNLKIYQKMKRENDNFSPRELYYYARELYFNNYISSAIKYLKKYVKINGTYPPDNLSAQIMLSDCFLRKNMQKHAKNALFECLKTHNPTSELCCKIAKITENEGKIKQAIFWYNSALHCSNSDGFNSLDYESIIPYIELSKLYYSIDYETAKNFHIMAKTMAPQNSAVLFNEKFFQQ